MGDASEHSLLSASGASRWTRCYGSIALESTVPNRGSKYAAEGTAAHGLAGYLLDGQPNKVITEELIDRHKTDVCAVDHYAEAWLGVTLEADGENFEITHDFARHVQFYVDYVKSLDGILLVETKVNYANWLGVPTETAWGTSDAIVIHDGSEEITIDEDGYCAENLGLEGHNDYRTGRLLATCADLKFGAGVPVYPERLEQGMLYTGGALNEIELMTEVLDTDIIRIVIHQPRIGEGAPAEWYVTVGELKKWLKVEAAMAAQHALTLVGRLRTIIDDNLGDPAEAAVEITRNELTPGDKQCKFCNAKAICPALTQLVVNTVANEFVDLDALETTLPKTLSAKMDVKALTPVELADKMRVTDLIEGWIKAVRGAVETDLLAGQPVPGYKLVRGKMGSRKWVDVGAALKTLKRVLGAKDAVEPETPISPTTVEKFVKAGKITERQWKAICENVTQSEGGISVAPESDKREAYVPQAVTEAAFQPIEAGEADDLSHLL
jgi:hypothetical protein